MSFNARASSFNSRPIFNQHRPHYVSQQHFFGCANGTYMTPQVNNRYPQPSPSLPTRANVCDPLAEGRRIRIDNVFYGTSFVPDFIGAVGIPNSDIERIHSTSRPSGGPGMCWVDFVSPAAASRAVEALKAELRKWMPVVFLCSPATELSGRATSTGCHSSDDSSHTWTDEQAIDREWPANKMEEHQSPASVKSHPWPSFPDNHLLGNGVVNSSLGNTSMTSLDHIDGNYSTRRTFDRASITTESTYNESGDFTLESMKHDAELQTRHKAIDTAADSYSVEKEIGDDSVQGVGLNRGVTGESKSQEIESWTKSIVATRQPAESYTKKSAANANSNANANASASGAKTWATVASPCPPKPPTNSGHEATKVSVKIPSVVEAPLNSMPGPSWADVTKKPQRSAVKKNPWPINASKQIAVGPLPNGKENARSFPIRKAPECSPKSTWHRTIFVTGLEPTDDHDFHREQILKIFSHFKVHGISNRKKIDRTSSYASCFVDMETVEDAQRAIDTWPWPTDMVGGDLLHVARAKSESNRPLDYMVVRELGERQSRRKR